MLNSLSNSFAHRLLCLIVLIIMSGCGSIRTSDPAPTLAKAPEPKSTSEPILTLEEQWKILRQHYKDFDLDGIKSQLVIWPDDLLDRIASDRLKAPEFNDLMISAAALDDAQTLQRVLKYWPTAKATMKATNRVYPRFLDVVGTASARPINTFFNCYFVAKGKIETKCTSERAAVIKAFPKYAKEFGK